MRLVSLDDVDRPTVDDGFRLAELAAGDRTSILHYTIDPGVRVPRHQHEHEQLGYVFAGELTFLLDDGTEVTAGPDDTYTIDAHEGHAAVNRGEETVLGIDIFSPPRTDLDWESWVTERHAAEGATGTEGE
ncbi:cupin domain-containing protein [Haloglomus litoreum]|uniref:cupin domain-containing protein n=1 Tax=Haloglomus litoreum TaxID=3034026 RepID=UPI0023E8B954|nr:cupin domain-containing protein [Haloglomus sp. DT116]